MSQPDRHKTCPYRGMPENAYWRQGVSTVRPEDLNPASTPTFSIAAEDRIATAGSCFAQHISRHLDRSGYHFLVTEQPHPLIPTKISKLQQYGVFSARYGNIYTTRQLHQLLQRSYGLMEPAERVWEQDGIYLDPYRPFIQPGGFTTLAEINDDQQRHFAAVRQLVETCDVFVFTLGLTEAWLSSEDGMVFPVCPGCGAGEFDPECYAFKNFSASETRDDLEAALNFIRARNPSVRIVLTVSPVPLIATAEARHVLTSTSYSKAALRVAAEEVSAALDQCDYFPSYEIITSPHARGAYFDEDLRSIKPEGVKHVMRCFAESYLGEALMQQQVKRVSAKISASENLNDILCDEEELVR